MPERRLEITQAWCVIRSSTSACLSTLTSAISACKARQQSKAMYKAMLFGKSRPHDEDVPIVASTDFTSAGITTNFH